MQLTRPRSLSLTTDIQPVADTKCLQKVFSLHTLACSLVLRYSNNLGPFTTRANYFLLIVFCIFRLALISRSQLYAFGHRTLVLPNSLLTSDLNSKIFLGTFVSSILIIFPTNSKLFPPFNIDCLAWLPQFLVSYEPTNLSIKLRLPQCWHITYCNYKNRWRPTAQPQ
jgi:hypothetical protein